jgi:thiol-disulfide isomerase/thioredoxin
MRLLPLAPGLFALLLVLAGCQKPAPAPNAQESAALPDQPAWNGPAAEPDDAVPAPKLDRSHAGSAAPADEFQDPDGEPVSLAVFAGKPLLLNLWATWCAPCVAEMPTLDALAGRSGGRLQIVALSQDMDGRQKVEKFFAEHRFKTLEPYLDPKADLMAGLKLDTLPTTILYDSKGREVWRVTGIEDWRSARAGALIDEAFKPAKG